VLHLDSESFRIYGGDSQAQVEILSRLVEGRMGRARYNDLWTCDASLCTAPVTVRFACKEDALGTAGLADNFTKMFKLIVVVLAALVAFAAAEAKPGYAVAAPVAYTSGYVSPYAYSGYSAAPAAYSAYSTGYTGYTGYTPYTAGYTGYTGYTPYASAYAYPRFGYSGYSAYPYAYRF